MKSLIAVKKSITINQLRMRRWVRFAGGLLLCSWVCACHSHRDADTAAGSAAMALMLDDADAPQTAIVQVRTPGGPYETYLINGNKNHTMQLAVAPALLTAVGDSAFEIGFFDQSVVLCDCAKWQEGEQEEECPVSREVGRRQPLELSQLAGKDSGVDESIDILPTALTEEEMGQIAAFQQDGVVTGVLGPYVFMHFNLNYQLCNEDQTHRKSGYRIFNLETRQFDDLLTAAERTEVNENERMTALESLRGAVGFERLSADDLVLTDIRPVYVQSLGFSLSYQFEAQNRLDATQNNWAEVYREVSVQARTLPFALMPHALAPTVVRNLMPAENVSVVGWRVLAGSLHENGALLERLLQKPIDSLDDALSPTGDE